MSAETAASEVGTWRETKPGYHGIIYGVLWEHTRIILGFRDIAFKPHQFECRGVDGFGPCNEP